VRSNIKLSYDLIGQYVIKLSLTEDFEVLRANEHFRAMGSLWVKGLVKV